MAKRILVPVDGSEQAAAATAFAVENVPDAAVVLLHVINPAEAGYSAQASVPSFSEEWYEEKQAQARDRFDELAAVASDAGAESVERVVEVGRPTKTIVEYADEHDVDQIVMGSHGRSGMSRILLGSVAEIVVRRATVPVTRRAVRWANRLPRPEFRLRERGCTAGISRERARLICRAHACRMM
jgi:nucleotide-binding universal stress UspA family protein